MAKRASKSTVQRATRADRASPAEVALTRRVAVREAAARPAIEPGGRSPELEKRPSSSALNTGDPVMKAAAAAAAAKLPNNTDPYAAGEKEEG